MTQAAAPSPAASNKPAGGLEGVVAAKSAICHIDGTGGHLVYRGYEIGDLVENTSFEEVAYLLWDEKLPNRAELEALRKQIASQMTLPDHVSKLLKTLPEDMQPMDALRTATSALGAKDPDLRSNEPDANRRKAV